MKIDSIKIKDLEFSHAPDCVNNIGTNIKPRYFNWYRGEEYRDITVYTDRCLTNQLTDSKYHIAWLLEPPAIRSLHYEYIKNNFNKFDLILTYNQELLNLSEKFKLFPFGGAWLNVEDFNIYPKSKNISIIASEKRTTVGHRIRHEIIEKHKDKFDFICGRGYKPIDYKLEALKDFRYSFPIENSILDIYFTDRIIECFLTGTVPIYYGSSLIEKYFNKEGIIFFNDINQLEDIFKMTTESFYNSKLKIIKENFELAKKYAIIENNLYLEVFSKL